MPTAIGIQVGMGLNDFGFDVLVVFDRAHRAARLVEASESVQGVTRVEVWDVRGAPLESHTGEDIQGQLWGVPDGSELFSPRITSGRALLPEDDRAILLNTKSAGFLSASAGFLSASAGFLSAIAADEGIQIGDAVTLTIEGEELSWTVVGLIISESANRQVAHYVHRRRFTWLEKQDLRRD